MTNQAIVNESGLTMSSLIAAYWSPAELVTNGLILLNLAGALLLGLMTSWKRGRDLMLLRWKQDSRW